MLTFWLYSPLLLTIPEKLSIVWGRFEGTSRIFFWVSASVSLKICFLLSICLDVSKNSTVDCVAQVTNVYFLQLWSQQVRGERASRCSICGTCWPVHGHFYMVPLYNEEHKSCLEQGTNPVSGGSTLIWFLPTAPSAIACRVRRFNLLTPLFSFLSREL